jgi:hypothetical protein
LIFRLNNKSGEIMPPQPINIFCTASKNNKLFTALNVLVWVLVLQDWYLHFYWNDEQSYKRLNSQ